MNIHKYEKQIQRTCADLDSDFDNKLHMALGIATEAGELLDNYKKNLAYGKSIDTINVIEEMGDCFWYLVNLCRMMQVDPEEVMEINVRKLMVRYPTKFTEQDANERNLDAEREALEFGKRAIEFGKKLEQTNNGISEG